MVQTNSYHEKWPINFALNLKKLLQTDRDDFRAIHKYSQKGLIKKKNSFIQE